MRLGDLFAAGQVSSMLGRHVDEDWLDACYQASETRKHGPLMYDATIVLKCENDRSALRDDGMCAIGAKYVQE